MSNSNLTLRPNEAMAKAAAGQGQALYDRYQSETQSDRALIDQYNSISYVERPEYVLVQAARGRIFAAEQKYESDVKQFREILDAWKPIREKRDALIEDCGPRYADATLDNYIVKYPEQPKIIQSLRNYAEQSAELVPKGKNVILLGPKGTGKDHLLMGLAKEVLRYSGFTTKWENGCEMRERSRNAAIGQRSFQLSDLSDSKPDILWISDPLLPSGSLSDYQQDAIFSVIDRQYRNLKPVWITINVADGEEAERRMGAQTVDRLRHDALILVCNWPSFRLAT